MEIHVRPILHTHDEISMGQVMFYEPPYACNNISVTANHNGFTTLSAVARKLDIDRRDLENLSELANHTQQIQLRDNRARKLFIVPKTKGYADVSVLMEELLQRASIEQITTLNFTHYNFIQKYLPTTELTYIFETMRALSPILHLERIIFDVDARALREFQKFAQQYSSNKANEMHRESHGIQSQCRWLRS